jgi:endonuclease-3
MKTNIGEILRILNKTYPRPKIALGFGDVWQLLVVVILSAQCTDKRVNMISPALFARFKTVKDFAECKLGELEKLIYSTGFYRAKAKNIKGAARMIEEKFGGEVPPTMEDLLKLPGVARKTANVILWVGYCKIGGVCVDTHVCRIAGLWHFVPKKMADKKDALNIEKELMKIVPQKDWGDFSMRVIDHGRKICIARKPKCEICPLNQVCPSAFIKRP